MKTATMLFHQGWTDIINCLPLINYYSPKYDKINIIIRDDAQPLTDYYLSNITNVESFFYKKYDLDYNLYEVNKKYSNTELLYFGVHDKFRNDDFTNSFLSSNKDEFFVKKFYTSYKIDYIQRINSFNLHRNSELEQSLYENFISKHGESYILYHEDVDRGIILNKTKFDTKQNWVDLDKTTFTFFDYIKILQNSKEIHLIDSVWAAIIYLVDSKYGLFKNIPIKVYCLRGYQQMFQEPIKLNNWEIL